MKLFQLAIKLALTFTQFRVVKHKARRERKRVYRANYPSETTLSVVKKDKTFQLLLLLGLETWPLALEGNTFQLS